MPLNWQQIPLAITHPLYTRRPTIVGPQNDKGGSPYLGWRWPGGRFVPAAAEIFCRPSIGRHWAVGGTGQAQGLPLQWWRGGSNTGRCLNRFNCPRRWGLRRRALRGKSPRTREGRRPDRPKKWGKSEEERGEKHIGLPRFGARIDRVRVDTQKLTAYKA